MPEVIYIVALGTFVLFILIVAYLRELVNEWRSDKKGEVEITSRLNPDGRFEEIVLVRKLTKEGVKKYIVRREFKGRKLLKEEVITEVDKVVVGRGSLWIKSEVPPPDTDTSEGKD